ncbi:hypothetical protein GA0115236_126414, partial [Streptomyces sp. IgraMP-1]
MSSRTDRPTHPTGAPRAHRAPASRKAGKPAQAAVTAAGGQGDDAHLDGLFTYCLSILHDHDLAHSALAEVVALAARNSSRPARGPAGRRAWLYALARWVCLRELAEAQAGRPPAHAPRERRRAPD